MTRAEGRFQFRMYFSNRDEEDTFNSIVHEGVDKIFNAHESEIQQYEAQLKAKDAEIVQLYYKALDLNVECTTDGYNLGIKKARAIVAMLGKTWKRSKQILGKNDEITISDQLSFNNAQKILRS